MTTVQRSLELDPTIQAVVVEEWTLPDGFDLIELSIKVAPERSNDARRRSWRTSRGTASRPTASSRPRREQRCRTSPAVRGSRDRRGLGGSGRSSSPALGRLSP